MGIKSHSDVRTGYPLGKTAAFRASFHTVVASRISETETNAGNRNGEKVQSEIKTKLRESHGTAKEACSQSGGNKTPKECSYPWA